MIHMEIASNLSTTGGILQPNLRNCDGRTPWSICCLVAFRVISTHTEFIGAAGLKGYWGRRSWFSSAGLVGIAFPSNMLKSTHRRSVMRSVMAFEQARFYILKSRTNKISVRLQTKRKKQMEPHAVRVGCVWVCARYVAMCMQGMTVLFT